MNRPSVIDLFSGAGGMALGFRMAGFTIRAAVEADPLHATTFANNFPEARVLAEDIRGVSGAKLAADNTSLVDVLIAGPPCQGFSVMGRRSAADPRNAMLGEVARLVAELRPRYLVVENVPGLRQGRYAELVQGFVAALSEARYQIDLEFVELDAASFGVPQRRRRLFLVARLAEEQPVEMPAEATGTTTVWDAIGDLDEISTCVSLDDSDVYFGKLGTGSEYANRLRVPTSFTEEGIVSLSGCLRPRHSVAVAQRFAATPPGTREPISRFQRLAVDGLAGTIRAGTTIEFGKYMAPRPIHPTRDRCITVREAARLQSFPDCFQFHPTRWHGFQQVGNAVPPFLAEAVARSVLAAMNRSREAL